MRVHNEILSTQSYIDSRIRRIFLEEVLWSPQFDPLSQKGMLIGFDVGRIKDFLEYLLGEVPIDGTQCAVNDGFVPSLSTAADLSVRVSTGVDHRSTESTKMHT